MKYSRPTLLACLLSLQIPTSEAGPTLPGPGNALSVPSLLAPKKGVDPLAAGAAALEEATTTTVTSQSLSRITSSITSRTTLSNSATSKSATSQSITLTSTISTIPYSTSTPFFESSTSSPMPTSTTPTSTENVGSSPLSTSTMSTSISSVPVYSTPTPDLNNKQHETLIIVLSVVLGVVAILLVLSAAFLASRYFKRQRPFSHRGASPINDDEIASWREPGFEQKKHVIQAPPPVKEANIGLAQFPGWRWNAPPANIQPVYSPSSVAQSPSFRAPNSRAGLTDETIPGAAPFIPPPKRQNSRLSKTPPGHSRTRSRRSSASNKSMWSHHGNSSVDLDWKPSPRSARHPTWYDPEDNNVGREFRDMDQTSSSPGTSIFDGLAAGGLSPRPASRSRPWGQDKEIGRAIA
ncbi:hypothetical protein BGZ60DRAFT_412465 [Tricladium varicosporioides]|nr:hypothetical protein BGZ60DRAFT_412465 [Hymenoscyphus varicosporioides]